MDIITSDEKKVILVGTSDVWFSLYSTVCVLLNNQKDRLENAIAFLKTCTCKSDKAEVTCEEMKEIQLLLTDYSPDQAIYDMNNLAVKAPWVGEISENVRSCADLFTTSIGENLITEIIDVLSYAASEKVDVILP